MSVINLGKQGETNVRQVQLDVSRLVTLFGPGTVQLLHRRPGDVTPYPVALTRSGDVVTWAVTAADTAYSGEGQAELQYFAGDSLAKSETYTTTITASQGDAGATPPEPQAGWVTQVLQAGTDAAEAAARAESAALHPPIIGENGNWWLWSFADEVYVDSGTSALGSDADVTAENIKSALGYAPADQAEVEKLSNEKVDQDTFDDQTKILSGEVNSLKNMIFWDVEYEERVTSDNRFDNVFDVDGRLDLITGADKTSSSMTITSEHRDLGEVVNGKIYLATSAASSTGYRVDVCLYDENKTFLTYIKTADSQTTTFYGSVSVTGARYFRINKTKTYTGLVYVSMVNPGSAESADYEFKEEMVAVGVNGVTINANKKLAGKIVVNFGDSIFGKRRPPDDISTKLADLTGATVYNCGFGGCQMSNDTTTNYNPFGMCNLADAVANQTWTTQEAAIASGGLPSYFSETLEMLKELDFGTVDIITILYGTNDFAFGRTLEDVSAPFDTNTYAGALRYSIETLLTAYPHLKIFVCTPIYRVWLNSSGDFSEDSDTKVNGNGAKLTDFVEKTKIVSKEYKIPVIDCYYSLGVNKFNRTQYLSTSDGTHPAIAGCHLIAELMANEMF